MIAVHDLGGDGDALLVCLATGFCGRMYEPFARTLRAQHHTYALDLRGHGDSPLWPGASLEWPDITADACSTRLGALADASICSVTRSVVPLPSLPPWRSRSGSLRCSCSNRSCRRRGMRAPVENNPMVALARQRTEVFAARVDARERFTSRASLAALHDEVLDCYVTYGLDDCPDGTVRLKCRAETEATIYETTGGISVDDVAEVMQPVTIGSGDPESSILAALAAGTAAGIPAARHIVYSGRTHRRRADTRPRRRSCRATRPHPSRLALPARRR